VRGDYRWQCTCGRTGDLNELGAIYRRALREKRKGEPHPPMSTTGSIGAEFIRIAETARLAAERRERIEAAKIAVREILAEQQAKDADGQGGQS